MKTGFISILFFCISVIGLSQSNRNILLENFIQASCQPCAYYNQETQNFLDTTTLSVIVLNYHTPFPGEDPMYNQNPDIIDSRMNFYGINEVPISVIDGSYFQGGPLGSYFNGENGWTVDDMQDRAEEESPLELLVNHEFINNEEDISIEIDMRTFQRIEGDLSLNVIIIEKTIEFDIPAGTNGERKFRYVVKDDISDQTGLIFPGSINSGFQQNVSLNWQISQVFEKEMISVVVFFQDTVTKEVFQAGISSAKAINDYDIEIAFVIQPTETYCNDPIYTSIAPVLKVRNRGGENIDSIIVYSKINDEAIDTSNYSVDMGFFLTRELVLPVMSYLASAPDTVRFTIELPNVVNENETSNNTKQIVFDTIPDIYNPYLFLHLQPDNYGSEITWELVNELGSIIYSGGPYENFNTDLIIDTLYISKKGCYSFTIFDSFGDGLQSGNGEGNYSVIDENGNIIFSGGDFKSQETNEFKIYRTPPVPIFEPVDNAKNVSVEDRVKVRFLEIIRFLNDAALLDPDSLFYLKKGSIVGEEVNVNFVLNSSMKTVYFDEDLEYFTDYYLGFKEGLEDIYDNPIPAQGITFRTQAEFTNIKETNESKIKLVPNPAKDHVIIDNPANETIRSIEIYNQTGIIVKKRIVENRHSNSNTIDIKSLAPGIYIVRVVTKKSIQIHKLIKVN